MTRTINRPLIGLVVHIIGELPCGLHTCNLPLTLQQEGGGSSRTAGGRREDARAGCLKPEGEGETEDGGGEEMQLHTQQLQPTAGGWG
jgi:hypothetical protein